MTYKFLIIFNVALKSQEVKHNQGKTSLCVFFIHSLNNEKVRFVVTDYTKTAICHDVEYINDFSFAFCQNNCRKFYRWIVASSIKSTSQYYMCNYIFFLKKNFNK